MRFLHKGVAGELVRMGTHVCESGGRGWRGRERRGGEGMIGAGKEREEIQQQHPDAWIRLRPDCFFRS